MSTSRDTSKSTSKRIGSMSVTPHSEFPMVAQPDKIPRLTRGPTSSELGEELDGNLVDATADAPASTISLQQSVVNMMPVSPPASDEMADLFALTPSPEKVDAKRARRPTTASRSRLPSQRRAVSQPGGARAGRSPARRSAWPDAAAAQHRHVPFDPAASDAVNMNKLVEQVQSDGEHMAILKAGIERLHETVETQAALLAAHGQRLDEQAAINLRGFQEHAELKGDLTQRAVRLETATEALLTQARGPAMTELISEVCTVAIEEKIASIGADMEKVKVIVELHDARELEMASYLEGLAGERPTEGRFITGKFEVYDRSFAQVRDELARQHGVNAEQFASSAAVSAVGRAQLEQVTAQLS